MKIKEERKCAICYTIFKTLSTSNRKTCSTKCSIEYREGSESITKRREYQQRPKYKAKRREYYQRPENIAKQKEYYQIRKSRLKNYGNIKND